MWTRLFVTAMSLVLPVVLVACTGRAASSPSTTVATGDYTIAAPVQHENLTLFLIHGPDKIKGKSYLTLQEGLEQKKVVVYETGNVNELAVENVSDEDVYIQSGDIVKGGRQDRTIQNDLVLSGKSGKISLASFCVESGRWHQRGSESAGNFDSSSGKLATKSLQMANRAASDQGTVWKEVGEAQQKLSANAGESVNDPRSESSLQLSLENRKVQGAVDDYYKALEGTPKGQGDVIGYAFAVNGKLSSVDIYASHSLFEKMWEKNLRAAGTEAFAEFKKDAKWDPVTAVAVKTCLEDSARGKASSKELTERIKLVTRESKDNFSYETYDAKAAAPAHVNILTRDAETEKLLQQRQTPPLQQDFVPNGPARQQSAPTQPAQ